MAFELGTTLVLARVGALPPETDAERRAVWISSVRELGLRPITGASASPSRPAPSRAVRSALSSTRSTRWGWRPVSTPPVCSRTGSIRSRRRGSWALGRPCLRQRAGDFRAGQWGPTGLLAAGTRLGGVPRGPWREINYRGFLTIWTDPAYDPAAQFTAIADRLKRL